MTDTARPFVPRVARITAHQWYPGKRVEGIDVDYHQVTPDATLHRFVLDAGPDKRYPLLPGDWIVTLEDGTRLHVNPRAFALLFGPAPDVTA